MRDLAIDFIAKAIWETDMPRKAGWYHTTRYRDILVKMYEHVPRNPASMPKTPKWLKSGYDSHNPMAVRDFFDGYDWSILSDEQLFELLIWTTRRQYMQM